MILLHEKNDSFLGRFCQLYRRGTIEGGQMGGWGKWEGNKDLGLKTDDEPCFSSVVFYEALARGRHAIILLYSSPRRCPANGYRIRRRQFANVVVVSQWR